MKKSLIRLLRCPKCEKDNLNVEVKDSEDEEILSGSVSCTCGHRWPISRGILRTVASDSYVQSFSFEWQLHRKTQLDNEKSDKSSRVFRYKTGIKPEDFAGKEVLDLGVGTGRYGDVIERAGGKITGIDLSFAVETSMENIGRRSNANIIQGNVFELPFRPESFDLIYSIGVLHHTPDCKKAFLSLIPFLKPGGTIVIWVYDAHVWAPGSILETSNRLWRSITTRLPSSLLYALCICELPLYFLKKIPGFDQLLHLILPGFVYHAIPKTNRHPMIREHILDIFDWYSPKYQSKHTYPEVFSWFEEAGLNGIRILPHPVGISGSKPRS